MLEFKPATILAATALVVAVFGSTPLGHAAADLVLAKNSVGTVQLKKDAVTGAKVKNGSLLAADFKAGQLPAGQQGPKGDIGPQGIQGVKGDSGPAGPKGDKGDPGSAGPPGISGIVEVTGYGQQVAPGDTGEASVACPEGKKALSGEFFGDDGTRWAPEWFVATGGLKGWYVEAKNVGAVPGTLTVQAICATVS